MASPVSWFRSLWNGRARLWQAFWLVAVLGYWLCVFVMLALLRAAESLGLNVVVVTVAASLWFLAIIVFSCVCVWRCAGNTSHEAMTALAKVWVVVSILGWTYKAYLLATGWMI